MPRLNQVNAMVTGRKGEVERAVTEIYKIIQKEQLFNGRSRQYRPYDEEQGEKLPSESQKVQQEARKLIHDAVAKWTDLWDLTLTQDAANQQAQANIVVDGKVILKDVPVTNLLFLEKQINDVDSFVSKLPTPDPAEDWTHDPAVGLLRSKPAQSIRTKKEPSRFEKAPPTKEHPAQVELLFIDTPVGTWTTIQYSGCIQADEKNKILARIKKLKDAVKVAREQANMIEVEPKKAGEPLFKYIFGE